MDTVNNKNNQLLLAAQDTALLTSLLEDAVKLDFAPPREVWDLLHTQYAPLRFKAGTNPSTDHPLAAAHQRVATLRAHRFAKEHRPLIEIGPNVPSFMKIAQKCDDVHGCTIFSARDQSRFVSAAATPAVRGCRDTRFTDAATCLASGLSTPLFCVDGYQCCDFQAPFAIAIHSLYDIPLSDLATGMYRHGTQNLRAWMHIPLAALQTDRYEDLDNQTWFQTYERVIEIPKEERGLRNLLQKTRKDRRIRFGFLNDASFLYDHDYDTWMNYIKVGGFPTPFGFNVLIEKIRHNGTHWELSITRTNKGGLIHQRISNGLLNLVRIPDLFDMAKRNFCKYGEMTYIVCDRDKAAKLFHYILARREADFTFMAAVAYARSLLRAIRLGTELVETRWNVNEEDLVNITSSIYILATIYRERAAAVIALARTHIADLHEKRGWWERNIGNVFPKWLRRACHQIGHVMGNTCEPEKLITGKSQSHFVDFTFKFFEDITTTDALVEFEYVDEVTFDRLTRNMEHVQGPDATTLRALAKLRPENVTAMVTGVKMIPQDWAHAIGVEAYYPENETNGPLTEVYDAQQQHKIFVSECRRGARDPKLAKPLAATLAVAATTVESRPPPSADPRKLALLTGAPGAGKTTKLRAEVLPRLLAQDPSATVLFIVPTAALRIKYATTFQAPHKAATMHTAINILGKMSMRPKLIIVDEAFTMPMAYHVWLTQFANVLLLGDQHQIGHVDFSNLWAGCVTLVDFCPHIATETMQLTKRCPVDVTALPFISARYPGIRTTSNVEKSIQYVHGKYNKPGAQILTMTQDAKKRFGGNAHTVHEVQGETFETAILHLDGSGAEENLLRASPNHLVVGLTRHTKALFVREEKAGLLTTYMNMDPATAILADPSGTTPEALDIRPHAARDVEVTVHQETDAPYCPVTATVDSAMETLQILYPAPCTVHEYQAVVTTDIPNDGGATGMVRLDAMGGDTDYESKRHVVHRFPGAQRVKITNSRHQVFALSTLMARYAKKTKTLQETSARIEATRLFEALQRHITYKPRPEWQDEVFMEACEKFQERGHDVSDLKDIDVWTDQGATKVSFCVKQQQKPTLGKDPTTTNKAGQGIAAWEKTLNFTMIVWTRILERTLMEATDSRFHFISKYTDEQVQVLLDRLATGQGYDMLEGDWTEFDSSQNNVEHQLFMLQLEAIGCPVALREMFLAMMTRRAVHAPYASLVVESKKDSGRVDTLVGNTTFNAAVMLTLIDPATIDHVLFKGDDSLIMGHGLKVDTARVDDLEGRCGFKLKLATRKTGEFVSFVVNENGSALCLPRIAAKVATRSYTNKEDFDDYRTAIGVMLRPTATTTVASAMTAVNAAHYRLPQEHFDHLLSFLWNFAHGRVPFSATSEFENATLTCDVTSNRGTPPTTEVLAAKTTTTTATEPISICRYDKQTLDCKKHNGCKGKLKRFGMDVLSALA